MHGVEICQLGLHENTSQDSRLQWDRNLMGSKNVKVPDYSRSTKQVWAYNMLRMATRWELLCFQSDSDPCFFQGVPSQVASKWCWQCVSWLLTICLWLLIMCLMIVDHVFDDVWSCFYDYRQCCLTIVDYVVWWCLTMFLWWLTMFFDDVLPCCLMIVDHVFLMIVDHVFWWLLTMCFDDCWWFVFIYSSISKHSDFDSRNYGVFWIRDFIRAWQCVFGHWR
jgi:hypothetical protein